SVKHRKPVVIQEGFDAEKDPRCFFLYPRRRHRRLRTGGRSKSLQRECQDRSRRERDRRPRNGEHFEPRRVVKVQALLSNLKAGEDLVGERKWIDGSVRNG